MTLKLSPRPEPASGISSDTFVEKIKRIGVEQVEGLNIEIAGIRLVSTVGYLGRAQRQAYYITMGLVPGDIGTSSASILSL